MFAFSIITVSHIATLTKREPEPATTTPAESIDTANSSNDSYMLNRLTKSADCTTINESNDFPCPASSIGSCTMTALGTTMYHHYSSIHAIKTKLSQIGAIYLCFYRRNNYWFLMVID